MFREVRVKYESAPRAPVSVGDSVISQQCDEADLDDSPSRRTPRYRAESFATGRCSRRRVDVSVPTRDASGRCCKSPVGITCRPTVTNVGRSSRCGRHGREIPEKIALQDVLMLPRTSPVRQRWGCLVSSPRMWMPVSISGLYFAGIIRSKGISALRRSRNVRSR